MSDSASNSASSNPDASSVLPNDTDPTMSSIDIQTKAALDELLATPARSESQVIEEAPRGVNLWPSILLGLAAMAWAILWPAVPLGEDGPVTLNAMVGGAAMLLTVLSFAFHCPGASIVPVGDLPVSAVRLEEAFRIAKAFPETAQVVNAWVASGHPLRRYQLKVLEEYAWVRRAQVAAQELKALQSRSDDAGP